MKKIFFLFAAMTALSFASCKKQEAIQPDVVVPVEKATISVNLTGLTAYATKTTTIDHESTPTNVQLFVFRNLSTDKTQNILDVKATNAGLSFDVTATSGDKVFYALVNSPALSVTTESDFLAHVSNLDENAVATSFVMIGTQTQAIASGANTVQINVDRICSRIKIDKITNSLSAPYSVLKIQDIYVSNVAGDVNLATALSPSTAYAVSQWYNAAAYSSKASVDGLLYDNTIASDLANSTSTTGTHYLYAYPNMQTGANVTRLVVTAKIDNDATVYYYPITLPEAVTPNKSFNISDIIITRPGSINPNQPVELGTCNVQITVNPWADVTLPNPTI